MIVYLICDESGAKGYAELSEQYPGETGVFAGYFVPEYSFDEASVDLQSISNKYFHDDKCHIRGLQQEEMEGLRRDVFTFMRQHNIVCIYEAIHVEGFRREYLRIKQIRQDAKSKSTSGIKVSDTFRPPLLHEELFQGLFVKAVAFFIDHHDKNVDQMKILVDPVDFEIFKKFRRAAHEIRDFSPKIRRVSGWDPKKKKKVVAKMKIKTTFPDSYGMKEIEEIRYDINTAPCYMTMPADILANSLNHVFKKRIPQDVGKALNDRSSIKGHELFDLFYGLINDEKNESPCPSDIIYMHPLQKSRLRINS